MTEIKTTLEHATVDLPNIDRQPKQRTTSHMNQHLRYTTVTASLTTRRHQKIHKL